MTDTVLVNSEPCTQIDVYDRGLQYGDGLFETIAIRNGHACLWQRHMQRLRQGCEILNIEFPHEQQWLDDINRLAGNKNAVIKLIITRGVSNRGYAAADAAATRIVMMSAAPEYPQRWLSDGIKIQWCNTRLGLNSRVAGLKHLNRLEQVLARAEWPTGMHEDGIAEGIMMDNNGNVIEGVFSNIFMVRNQQLLTPKIIDSGVAGVMRAEIMHIAATMNIDSHEATLTPDDILQADEVFMTNSLTGLWIVRQLGDNLYSAGPVAGQLKEKIKSVSFA